LQTAVKLLTTLEDKKNESDGSSLYESSVLHKINLGKKKKSFIT